MQSFGKRKVMSSRSNLYLELTEAPTALNYSYIFSLFSLQGTKLCHDQCRQRSWYETLGNRSVKMKDNLMWVSPQSKGGNAIPKPATYCQKPCKLRICRGKEWMTPKVLEKCTQNMEVRRIPIYLSFRLNAMKIRRMYPTPKGSTEQGHHSRKEQNL